VGRTERKYKAPPILQKVMEGGIQKKVCAEGILSVASDQEGEGNTKKGCSSGKGKVHGTKRENRAI